MTPLRDWNEEYQQCKELPKGNLLQRIQRKRTIQKVYYEFVENSKIGAVKIIEGNVQSLNPNDALEQQIFIYNNIFFSFCVDSPLDFSNLNLLAYYYRRDYKRKHPYFLCCELRLSRYPILGAPRPRLIPYSCHLLCELHGPSDRVPINHPWHLEFRLTANYI